MPADEPQTQVTITPVPLENPVTANTTTDRHIFGCPDGVGYEIEVLGVSFSVVTVPADADGTVLCDIEFVDDSAADAKSDLIAGVDLESLTANVMNDGWRGSQVLDPGDTINLEFTSNSAAIDTAAVGLVAYVEHRVRKRSAG